LRQVEASVVSIREVMPGCYQLCVAAPGIADAAHPGQFVMVRCGDKLTLRRPISIHRVTESGEVYLFFTGAGLARESAVSSGRKIVPVSGKGEGTLWLSRRKKGDKLDLLGPLGNGFTVNPNSRNLLLVAGGIGIAPLVILAERAISQGKFVKLLLGARTKEVLYPGGLLPGGVEVELVTEDGQVGRKGMVSEYVFEYVGWADQIYACGPRAMYESIAREMIERNAEKPVQVSLEVRMGCGVGACYGCSIPTKQGVKRVCLDGPVFNLDEVLLEEVRL